MTMLGGSHAASEALPEATVRRAVEVPMRLDDGLEVVATVLTFSGLVDGLEHIALGLGDVAGADLPLVRLHSECLTGDVFGSARCDCGPQLHDAIRRIAAVGGYVLYLRQEGRGIGLYNKLDAYALQDAGMDTYEANRALGLPDDARDYRAAAQMLRALDSERVALLSNNPDKAAQLEQYGIAIAERQTTGVFVTAENHGYLEAKVRESGHSIDLTLPGWHTTPVPVETPRASCTRLPHLGR